MAKTREVACKFYSYAGGPCLKRQINVYLKKECQTCKKYYPLPGGKPARTDTRRQREARREKKEKWDY